MSPRAPRSVLRAAAALAALACAACSLLPEPEPAPRAYAVPLAPAAAPAPGVSARALRLRTVRPAPHLDEGVAWRAGLRVGARPGVRWSVRPEEALQWTLLARVFAGPHVVRSEAVDAAVLDALLLAFEERITPGEPPQAHVAVHVRLLDEARRELLARTVEVRRPLAPGEDATAALAEALGAGLDEACTALAAEIDAVLAR